MSNEPQQQQQQHIDPTALGLFGLAMVTLVASSQKLGITSGVSFIIPWALFLGASAQLMASIIDFKSRNIFGGTAFAAYAFFWYAMAFTWATQLGILGLNAKDTADPAQTGFAFIGYLIFSIFMTIGATKTNRVLLWIFALICLLFVGLALLNLGIAPEFGHHLAAYSELLIALLGFYGSGANIVNYQFKRTVLPLGKLS